MNRDLLTRYFQGECSEEEKTIICQWLEGNEAHQTELIRERIRFDASLMAGEGRSTPAVRRSLNWPAVAAASVILLLCLSHLFRYPKQEQPDVAMLSIHVPPGNRTSITLPDGSHVWLNSNTTLRYPNVFISEERTVELDGEAWFEVAQYYKKPFIVRTGKYNVEAVGTTFNVDAYAGNETSATALFTGIVKLYKGNGASEALYLHPGETAELVGGAFHVLPTDINAYRWRDGLIVIEDKSFGEIMQLFEKYYGLQIIIKNTKAKGLGYRGKFRIADGVEHALRVLQNDFRFTYVREENTDIIYIH